MEIIFNASVNFVHFITLLLICICVYQSFKYRKEIVQIIKEMFKNLISKEFWKYVVSLKWLFKGD